MISEIVSGAISIYLVQQFFSFEHHSDLVTYFSRQRFPDRIENNNKARPKLRVHIAGDSVGAGIGSSSQEKSFAGLIAQHFKDFDLILTNSSRPGATTTHVAHKQLVREPLDWAFVIVSTNDVWRLKKAEELKNNLQIILDHYSSQAKRVVFVGPAHLSSARAIPHLGRLFYALILPWYRKHVRETAEKYPNLTYLEPTYPAQQHFAPDKFHPNDLGYAHWFSVMKRSL